jgi:hypothetical protein
MRVSGKLIVLTLVGLGLAATLFSLWFTYRSTHRTLQMWGPKTARLIQAARQVTALRLEPAAGDAADGEAWLELGAETFHVAEARDFSHVRGLIHLRQVLLQDANFRWDAQLDDCRPTWGYALRFEEGGRTATLAFSLDCGRVALAGSDLDVALSEAVTRGLREFFAESFSKQAEPPAAEVAE